MIAKMRKWKRFILIAIMSCAFIWIAAKASAISFPVDQMRNIKLDFIKIENLNQTISAVRLDKNTDDHIEQVKLTNKENKSKKNINRNDIFRNSAEWKELRDVSKKNIDTNAAVIAANHKNSEPFHSPIPATVWIFGASLVTVIMIRRKIHSLAS
jgi:hypothetical protein